MSDEEFILKLKSSSFFNLLLDRPDTILIALCGSRITGVVDNHSDYDITILTTNENCEESDYRLRYNEHDVHWYYHNINKFVYTDLSEPAMNFLCPFLLGFITEDYIIYRNPKYEKMIEGICSVKKQLRELGSRMFYKKCKDVIDVPIKDNKIEKKYFSKFWGHLVCMYYVLTNQPINSELVLAAKRMRYKELTPQQEADIIKCVKKTKKYMETENKLSISELKNEIQSILKYNGSQSQSLWGLGSSH